MGKTTRKGTTLSGFWKHPHVRGEDPKILKGAFTVHPLKTFFAALACGLYSRELYCYTSPLYFGQSICRNIVYTIYSNPRISPKNGCQQLVLVSLPFTLKECFLHNVYCLTSVHGRIEQRLEAVSYTHLTLPTTPYV